MRGSRWRTSSRTLSAPDARISATIARATTSRAANSPSTSYRSMNRRPPASSKTPPSPRTASEMRKGGAPGSRRAVGWNWKNSMSITSAPARNPKAAPSPVTTLELVVMR